MIQFNSMIGKIVKVMTKFNSMAGRLEEITEDGYLHLRFRSGEEAYVSQNIIEFIAPTIYQYSEVI